MQPERLRNFYIRTSVEPPSLPQKKGIDTSQRGVQYERPVCGKCGRTGEPTKVTEVPVAPDLPGPALEGNCVIPTVPLRSLKKQTGRSAVPKPPLRPAVSSAGEPKLYLFRCYYGALVASDSSSVRPGADSKLPSSDSPEVRAQAEAGGAAPLPDSHLFEPRRHLSGLTRIRFRSPISAWLGSASACFRNFIPDILFRRALGIRL